MVPEPAPATATFAGPSGLERESEEAARVFIAEQQRLAAEAAAGARPLGLPRRRKLRRKSVRLPTPRRPRHQQRQSGKLLMPPRWIRL